MIKAFKMPIKELNKYIMKKCLETSNPNIKITDNIITNAIKNVTKNRDKSECIIFYIGKKPEICKKYPDINWDIELQKDEWQGEEI